MHKHHLYLVLWINVALIVHNAISATEDREHVHIKVHMPDMQRQHTHQHRIVKSHHKHKQHRPYRTSPLQQTRTHDDNHLAISPISALLKNEPPIAPYSLFSSADAFPHLEMPYNQGSMLFDNEIDFAKHPQHATTPQQSHLSLNKHLMQQIFTPEIATFLTATDDNSHHFAANKLLAELNQSNDNYEPADITSRTKTKYKRNKYSQPTFGASAHQYARPTGGALPTPQTNNHYFNNYNHHSFGKTNFIDFPDESDESDFEEDNNDDDGSNDATGYGSDSGFGSASVSASDFDAGNDEADESSQLVSKEVYSPSFGFNPISYPDMSGAYTTTPPNPSTATSTYSSWRSFYPITGTLGAQQHQHQGQHQAFTALSIQHPLTRPITDPITNTGPAIDSGNKSAGGPAATHQFHHPFNYQQQYLQHFHKPHQSHKRPKKRKNRTKSRRRERIALT